MAGNVKMLAERMRARYYFKVNVGPGGPSSMILGVLYLCHVSQRLCFRRHTCVICLP